jgi:HPt (histidine-containing phosphotransfer) domain-containing protein
MPGVSHRMAPEGARFAWDMQRQSDRLTPQEIAAGRKGREEEERLPPSQPAPDERAVAAVPDTTAIAAPAPATVSLAAGPPATLGAHAIAEMCAAAGVPELTLSMLQQPMTLKQVEHRLEDARLVLQCGSMSGLPVMGRQLMLAGVSVDAARKMINEALVRADEAIITDPTYPSGPTQAGRSGINSAAVYDRLNGKLGKNGKAG